MVFDPEKAKSDTDQPAVRTAKVLQKIAISLERDIQMTYDVPENHSDGKMPVLDLKIWVENNKIYYTFYKKDVSSKFIVLKRSALSESIKKETCFMEAVRRILNVSSELPWEETVSHLNRFSWTMKLSGYNEYDRYHAISGAIRRVSAMKDEVKSGVRVSLFRSRQQIVESKRNKKDWTNTWFLKGDTVGTISCPVTPGGVLKKTLNKQINSERDSKLLIVEDGGCPVYNGLKVRDPMRGKGCIFGDPCCIVDPSVQCDRIGVVYKIVCLIHLEC